MYTTPFTYLTLDSNGFMDNPMDIFSTGMAYDGEILHGSFSHSTKPFTSASSKNSAFPVRITPPFPFSFSLCHSIDVFFSLNLPSTPKMQDDAAYHLVQEANDEEKSWSKKPTGRRRISYYLHIIFLACLYATAVLAGALTVVIVEQNSRSAAGSLQMYSQYPSIQSTILVPGN
jgi:hypothetical protein